MNTLHRIAAFSNNGLGGNPAGVMLTEHALSEVEMSNIAAEVGYSETAFAYPLNSNKQSWRVRYFSPESEVPFCGHATIALGAVLYSQFPVIEYQLKLNETTISVASKETSQGVEAVLHSPNTLSRPLSSEELNESLGLFGLTENDLDERLAPAFIHAGAEHVVLPLKTRSSLSAMSYDLEHGRQMMRKHQLTTIMLVYIESQHVFHSRNAFASGGVFEDPATGAASAAFAGYLRDQGWPHNNAITIFQGEDMGSPSKINVVITDEIGAPVQVSGSVREISEEA